MKTKLMIMALAATLLATLISPLSAKGKGLEGVVNLNAATKQELMLLPGVGDSKAEAIIAFRQQHPFKSPVELAEVKGIGPKMIERLNPYLAVQGPTTLRETTGQVSKAPVAQ